MKKKFKNVGEKKADPMNLWAFALDPAIKEYYVDGTAYAVCGDDKPDAAFSVYRIGEYKIFKFGFKKIK